MNLPYASSTAAQGREKDIRAMLRSVGATAVGFMVDDDSDTIMASFRLQGREISVPIRIGAYAEAWIRENPCGPRTTRQSHATKARAIAEAAAWAILADWIKAQAAMIAAGFSTAESAFLPHVHLPDGRRVHDAMTGPGGPLSLPAPHCDGGAE